MGGYELGTAVKHAGGNHAPVVGSLVAGGRASVPAGKPFGRKIRAIIESVRRGFVGLPLQNIGGFELTQL